MGGPASARVKKVPQVVQTSAMDCGPAVLTAVLRGHGVPAGLEAVRDLCSTGVDGTSIDTLGALANALGLDATQRVVPADHLVARSVDLLPAIVITRLPDGLLHFVVVWRRFRGWVEVMDPSIGRRWVRWERLRHDLYEHAMPVDATAWRDFAATDRFRGPLTENLIACGFDDGTATGAIEEALSTPDWQPIARLDAAARRGRRTGTRAERIIEWSRSAPWDLLGPDSMVVPPAGPGPGPSDTASTTSSVDTGAARSASTPDLVMRGAIALSIAGVDADMEVPDELGQRVLVPEASAASVLNSVLGRVGRRRLVATVAAVALGSGGSISATYLLERIVDSGRPMGASALVLVVGVFAAAALVTTVGTAGVMNVTRNAEIALRRRIEERVGGFPDHYFASRPVSDLTERAHELHRIRELGVSLADLGMATSQLVAATVVMLVVAPASWWAVLVLVCVAVAVPMLFTPPLVEVGHRSRTIAGAMAHWYLDVLVGALVVRAHRSSDAVVSEHEELLGRWSTAERSHQRIAGAAMGTVLVLGYLCAGMVVITSRAGLGGPGAVALMAFAAYVVITSAEALASTSRRLAPQWVTAQRLLALSEVETVPRGGVVPGSGPVGIELRDVGVEGDHVHLLEDVTLSISPGEHVTIVGPSGAGKSTLVSVLMGWTEPATGQVLVNGAPLDAATGSALRRATAWVDPDVAIWSGTLEQNIYPAGRNHRGSGPDTPDGAGHDDVLTATGLGAVAARLAPGTTAGGTTGRPDLTAVPGVGEDGRLLSGGEAQRVRIARAVAREGTRLVVLDEADRGLDPQMRARIRDLLRHRFRGVTTITVTHDLTEACLGDRVVLMDHGRIVADGDPTELLSDADNAFARMVTDHHQLMDQLGTRGGWSIARLVDQRLVLDHPREAPSSGSADRSERHRVETRRRYVGPTAERPLRGATILLGLGVVMMVLEWTTFLMGWSDLLGDPRGRWWPLSLIVSALAAGSATVSLGLAGTRIGAALRRRLLSGCVHAPLAWIRRTGSGELLGRVLEAGSFEQHVVAGGTDLLSGLAQVFAALAVVVFAAPRVSLAALITGWLVTLTVVALGAVVSRRSWTSARIDRSRILLARFRGRRTESVYGPPPGLEDPLMVSYATRSRTSDRWRTALLTNSGAWLALGVVWVMTRVTADERIVALAAVVIAWGGFAALGTALDETASAAASVGAFAELAAPRPPSGGGTGRRTAGTDGGTSRADDPAAWTTGSYGHYHANTRGDGGDIGEPVVLRGIGDDRGDTRSELFRDLDWTITPGSRTVLRGESGSGKSTLAQIVTGLREPRRGSVEGADDTVYVPQYGDNHIVQASFAFNLLLGRAWPPNDADLDDAAELLCELGLHGVLDSMPRGLAQPIGETGWQLSHGERARVHLARAILQGGRTIVLDETLEGLDPDSARTVLRTVTHRFPSVVLISHH